MLCELGLFVLSNISFAVIVITMAYVGERKKCSLYKLSVYFVTFLIDLLFENILTTTILTHSD